MSAIASAHQVDILVGPEDLSFRREYVSLDVGNGARDRSGLLTVKGKLVLTITRNPPGNMNPRSSAGRALWHRGQLIKIKITKSDGSWADHPCGWLYILKEPLPAADPRNPLIELEIGCQLSLRSFAQPDETVASQPDGVINRTAAIATCLSRAGVSGWSGAVSAYPIPFDLSKQGGGFVELAGKVAYGGTSILYQTNQGQIEALPAALTAAASPVVSIRIGREEILYTPSQGSETPCEKVRYTGTGRKGIRNQDTVTTVDEDYGPASTISPKLGNQTIVLRRTQITERISEYGRERIELVEAPLGMVSAAAFPESGDLGLDSYTRTVHSYETSKEGKLLNISATEQRLYPAALAEFFKRQTKTAQAGLKKLIVYSKASLQEFVYTNKGVISSARTLTREPIGAIVPNESHTDAAALIYSGVDTEGYEQPRKNENWRRNSSVRPTVKVKPDIRITSNNSSDRVRVKTALITASNATEISNSGQTTPPAAERRPQLYTYEETALVGTANFETYPGSDQQERERPLNLDIGCVSAAQLTELAQIEGALLIGRRQGQQIQVPLLDELIDNPTPLGQWNCREPDGSIYCFQADAVQYTHSRDRAIVGCNGIWLATQEVTEADPAPIYSPVKVRPPYLAVKLSDPEAMLVLPHPETTYRRMIGGIRQGGNMRRFPYSLEPRIRQMVGGGRMGGGLRRVRFVPMIGGIRQGGSWSRVRSFRGGIRQGGRFTIASGSSLDEGLIALYHLNGNGLDEIGSADLTPDTGVTWVTGRVNQAAGFSGAFDGTDRLTVTDSALTMGSAITISFWIKNFPLDYFVKRDDGGSTEWRFGAFESDGITSVDFAVRANTGALYNISIDFGVAGFASRSNTFAFFGWSDGAAIGLEMREVETGTIATAEALIESGELELGGLSGATLQVGSGYMSSSSYIDVLGVWNRDLIGDERSDWWNSGDGKEKPF